MECTRLSFAKKHSIAGMALALHAASVIETAITSIATDGQMCLCLVVRIESFFFLSFIFKRKNLMRTIYIDSYRKYEPMVDTFYVENFLSYAVAHVAHDWFVFHVSCMQTKKQKIIILLGLFCGWKPQITVVPLNTNTHTHKKEQHRIIVFAEKALYRIEIFRLYSQLQHS